MPEQSEITLAIFSVDGNNPEHLKKVYHEMVAKGYQDVLENQKTKHLFPKNALCKQNTPKENAEMDLIESAKKVGVVLERGLVIISKDWKTISSYKDEERNEY